MVCDPRWALLLFFVGCRVFTEPFLHSCEQVGCFRRLVVTPNQDRALFDLPPRQDINQSAMNTKLRSLARPNWLASAWPR